MKEWVINIMTALDYWGIALLMFLENLFPPIPSELIMPLAGFTVAQGKLTIVPVIVAGVIGTILGALPWYYLGKLVSEERIRKLVDRYGKWAGISGADIERANDWFRRYDKTAVFLGRLIPGVRTLISLPAGLNVMPMIPFLLYSTIGTTIWICLLTGAGYVLGNNYELVETYLDPISKVVVIGLGLAILGWIVLKIIKKNKS
jgi:membrane protein DedA with SNARE-associated domain